ncbi:MAG TPA: ABC transporter ATP-binding protein [Kiritimatiellia bacterium]|jgi:cobalt/nickel transport system ATP-binding protein|nr:MAG: Cobalt import ATP-binding protein CbiO [Verrucomicrobia bacterium ADurb.Bin070]HPB10311.1 ABC transporter ATP-binding protein [Kiritimatiellia bacterium]HQA37320.1 ABC transporter ATP-binding protein [Kiritimatiellia bacterium]HQL49766.1 ABC transporter ATP-binding protein [Kiritimatiellia bacterium]HQQ91095.1 ABC transporter ATP-binding protein [Kiritimatiellia bacterium]
MPSVIEIKDASYVYPDGTQALHAVSLCVEAGEAVALVGANGAGKSTLLLHMNGTLLATQGEVRVAGVEVSRLTLSHARRTVGMVFQDPDDQLFMPTVEEDVAFGPRHAGMAQDDVERRTHEALARVGMSHLRMRPPYRLSAGEKRAVAIATVLAMAPGVLVMDEPSSNLDPRGRRRLIAQLRSFEHARVIATHDLELVVEVCTRVIVLDGGRVVAQGPVRELLNDEARMLAHGLERPHILRHQHPH